MTARHLLVSHLWGDDKTRSLSSGVCRKETDNTAGLAGAMGPRKRGHHADTGLTTCFIHTCLSNPMGIKFYK